MYNFTWNGKRDAIRIAQTPSTGTLRPDKESSKNWDDTENLYIEGDNLEVLKLLQKSYFGKVDMIYIDPPYNTGNDFVYKDNFRDNIANYKETTSQTTKANPETNGRYHTDWLNMMYSRLKVSRNLLTNDGVIFISIDDNEFSQLKLICDEIFGEENFITNLAVENNPKGRKNSSFISKSHEHCLIYLKNKNHWRVNNLKFNQIDLSNDKDKRPILNDDFGEFKKGKRQVIGRNTNPLAKTNPSRCFSIYYSIENNDIKLINEYKEDKDELVISEEGINLIKMNYKRYIPIDKNSSKPNIVTYTKNKLLELHSLNNLLFLDDSIYEKERDFTIRLKSILTRENTSRDILTETAGRNLVLLLGKNQFDFPKPTDFIALLCSLHQNKDALVLDFFSGSASTAHAIMKLNIEDRGSRKFIMVQLPELTKETSESYKAGYKNICEIGKERIRRAGDKIVSENKDKEGIEKLDIGFKVFKLKKENNKMLYNKLNNDDIRIELINRPKIKNSKRIKIDNEIYYLVENEEEYIVFNYSKGQKEVIASIFNKGNCKNVDYMELERLYTDKLVEFNQGWYHSNYVTVRILDEIYKETNN